MLVCTYIMQDYVLTGSHYAQNTTFHGRLHPVDAIAVSSKK